MVRARVDDLKPLVGLATFAAAVPGAEPPRAELVAELRAGRQAYQITINNSTVLCGIELFYAAKAVGLTAVEVVVCPGCDGLHAGDLLLMAAGLHFRAIRDRRRSDAFDARLLAAKVYGAWVQARKRRPPRPTPLEKRAEREALRRRLIKEAFGRSARSLERDAVLAGLPAGLQDAIRSRRLPEQAIEAAAKLTRIDKLRLAAALNAGKPFTEVGPTFFDTGGRRKSSGSGSTDGTGYRGG